MSKFVIFKDVIREYRFNLIADNGKVVCVSEGYVKKSGALNGIKCIKRIAKKSKIVDLV